MLEKPLEFLLEKTLEFLSYFITVSWSYNGYIYLMVNNTASFQTHLFPGKHINFYPGHFLI